MASKSLSKYQTVFVVMEGQERDVLPLSTQMARSSARLVLIVPDLLSQQGRMISCLAGAGQMLPPGVQFAQTRLMISPTSRMLSADSIGMLVVCVVGWAARFRTASSWLVKRNRAPGGSTCSTLYGVAMSAPPKR